MPLNTYNKANNEQQSVVSRSFKIPKSRCNLSKIINGNMDLGEIKVLDHISTLPDEWYDMDYILNLTTRVPTARPLKNGMRVYITAVYSRNSDLWEGWNEFITRGRSGASTLKIPSLYPFHELGSVQVQSGQKHAYRFMDTPMSLWDDFGLPCSSFPKYVIGTYPSWPYNKPLDYHLLPMGVADVMDYTTRARGWDITGLTPQSDNGHYSNCLRPELEFSNDFFGNKVSALPFMAYQKYCMFYHNCYDLQNGFSWTTELPELFRLPRIADINFTTTSIFDNSMMDTIDIDSNGRVRGYCTSDYAPPTGTTFYQYGGNGSSHNGDLTCDDPSDTTTAFSLVTMGAGKELVVGSNSARSNGCKYPIDLLQKRYTTFRGDEFLNASPFANLCRGKMPTLSDLVVDTNVNNASGSPSFGYTLGIDSTDKELNLHSSSYTTFWKQDLANAMRGFDSISMNTLRSLSMLTHFVELNGHTDGTYNDIINAQFDYNPSVHTGKPTYIGGSYADVSFTQLQQTGGSVQIGSDVDYLGKRVSEGSCSCSANLGKFHSSDYGQILVVAYCVPDTNYNSSCSPEWTNLTQNTQYYPVLSESAPRGIKRKEMYATFNDSLDNEIIGFEEAWSYLRMRHNTVNGLLAMGERELFDSQMIMRRKYVGSHGYDLNAVNKYCSPWTIDYSVFGDNLSPVFFADVGAFVSADRPVPYSSAHNYL